MDLSFIAMIGSIGLVGIVVNDALVLIEFINQLRAKGMACREAVIEATTSATTSHSHHDRHDGFGLGTTGTRHCGKRATARSNGYVH